MSAVTDNIGYAEAQALKRRERILKLRKKVEGKPEDEEIKDPDSQSPRYFLSMVFFQRVNLAKLMCFSSVVKN